MMSRYHRMGAFILRMPAISESAAWGRTASSLRWRVTGSRVSAVMVGSEGGFYLTDWPRIRRIGTDGIITTVAGTGDFSYNGDDIPATQANIDAVSFSVT